MGLRVQAATTTRNLSSMNVSRIAALDKWKTDWFHEISNLFMVTTDQVVCSNDVNQTNLEESGPTSKYHSRMLQNRAKLNMVVSMVERYIKGSLSVERSPENQENACDRASNITPWTMVSPDEICPVDHIHQNRESVRTLYKKRFTVDEALEKLSQNQCESDVNETPMNIDDDLMTALQREHSEKQNKIPDDLLAQACELLNSKEDCKTNVIDRRDEIDRLDQKQNDARVSCTTTDAPLNTDSLFCQSSTLQVEQTTSPNITNISNSQSFTSSGKYVVLSSNAKSTMNGNVRPISIQPDNGQRSASKQPKLVELVPATLPDGRVIHLEIVRQPSPALQTTLANSTGVKHVILPRTMNGKVLNKTKAKLLPIPKSLLSNNSSKPLSTTKHAPYVFTNGNVPMVCLKRPAAEFSSTTSTNQTNKTFELTPASPDFIRRLRESGAQFVLQKSTQHNSASVNIITQVPLTRKRTHDGEVKHHTENHLSNTSLPETQNMTDNSDNDNGNISRQSPTESIINNAEMPNVNGDGLNVNLLNELMDQLPSPDKDNDEGDSGDILEDILRQAEENTFSSKNTTSVKLETENSQVLYPQDDSTKNRKPIYENLSSVNEPPVLQNAETKRKRAISSDANRRKALSSLDVNARSKTISCDENSLMTKPKRKYTKRIEITEENGSTLMLGPTAAAAAKNPYQKPPLSYNILIYLAFKDAGFVCLTVKQIYTFILKTFPYFSQAHQTWQNAIRHQLCCCKVYEKVPIVEVENGVEKTTSRSAWKVLNNKCIEKLEEDTATTLAKKNVIEKVKTSLCDRDQFEPLFGEVLSKMEEKEGFVYETAKPALINVGYSRDQKLVHKSATNGEQVAREYTVLSPLMSSGSSTTEDDDVVTNEEFPYYGNFGDHIDPLFFDISQKTTDSSSIYNF